MIPGTLTGTITGTISGLRIAPLSAGQLVLAQGSQIQPGEHPMVHLFGIAFNIDTMISTLVAGVILVALGLWMARGASAGRPSKLQIIFEYLVEWIQGQVRDQMGMRAPRGVVALGVTLFSFILIANWLCIFEGAEAQHELLTTPTADVNMVYPMALLVIIWVNVLGLRNKGLKGYFADFAKPYAFLAPFEVITQYFARPVSLALRLWGNLFAGVIMIEVIGLMPSYVLWLPNAAWKLFDMFIGALQALIFALLTIIYFGEAVEESEAAEH